MSIIILIILLCSIINLFTSIHKLGFIDIESI